MAMGKRPDVTILVQVGEIRGISDIAGRHLIRMDNSSQARAELANALKKAGCDIDLNKGRRWRKAGDFQNTNSDRSPSS